MLADLAGLTYMAAVFATAIGVCHLLSRFDDEEPSD
jgi:hypothetical protein